MRSPAHPGERGGSFVELALCITPFVLLLWSAMSFAHAMFAYNSVAFLSREASRWAAVHTKSGSGVPVSEAAVAAYTTRRAAGLDKTRLNVRAVWSEAARPVGSTVTVTVAYSAVPLPLNILKSPLTVRSSSTTTLLH